jgi:hypothetical protein
LPTCSVIAECFIVWPILRCLSMGRLNYVALLNSVLKTNISPPWLCLVAHCLLSSFRWVTVVFDSRFEYFRDMSYLYCTQHVSPPFCLFCACDLTVQALPLPALNY